MSALDTHIRKLNLIMCVKQDFEDGTRINCQQPDKNNGLPSNLVNLGQRSTAVYIIWAFLLFYTQLDMRIIFQIFSLQRTVVAFSTRPFIAYWSWTACETSKQSKIYFTELNAILYQVCISGKKMVTGTLNWKTTKNPSEKIIRTVNSLHV